MRLPAHEAEDGWLQHVGALILRVHAPQDYLTILNAFPFSISIELLERTESAWQHAEPFKPIAPGTGGETLWEGELHLTTFLNTSRFVRHGYFAARPAGLTRVPNPLRERCPPDLVQAAVCDLHGRNLLILEPHLRARDAHYGCVYRFSYAIE